jgi:hypothetical protein
VPYLAQRELVDAHCLGDCAKVSAAGQINIGGHDCFVCCEEKCPHLKAEAGPVGKSNWTGDEVYVRALSPRT